MEQTYQQQLEQMSYPMTPPPSRRPSLFPPRNSFGHIGLRENGSSVPYDFTTQGQQDPLGFNGRFGKSIGETVEIGTEYGQTESRPNTAVPHQCQQKKVPCQ